MAPGPALRPRRSDSAPSMRGWVFAGGASRGCRAGGLRIDGLWALRHDPPNDFVERNVLKGQVHVRGAGHMAVACAGQRGRACREHDVVAVTVETRELGVAFRRFAPRQLAEPRAADSHLFAVDRVAKVRKPCAVVRRADGDYAVHPGIVG